MVSCWHVYIVRCADNSFYTGITTDVEKRLLEHNGDTKRGARYTRARRPVYLAYAEPVPDRSSALKREYVLRRLARAEKERLISHYQTTNCEFST